MLEKVKNRHAYLPGVLIGIPAGLLSTLPGLNMCCCMWTLAGGAIGVYFVQSKADYEIDNQEAVLIGLIAGLLSGLVFGINNVILEVLQVSSIFSHVEGKSQSIAGVLCGGLVLQPLFGALGGLIGATFVRKNNPPLPAEAALQQQGPTPTIAAAEVPKTQNGPTGLQAHPARPKRPGLGKDPNDLGED